MQIHTTSFVRFCTISVRAGVSCGPSLRICHLVKYVRFFTNHTNSYELVVVSSGCYF